MQNRLLSAASLVTALSNPVVGSWDSTPPAPARMSVRHIEPKGIGYNQGYTSLDLFFSSRQPSRWRPFLDLRGHIFNDGKGAFNGGIGLRYVGERRVVGGNVFYDYRNTKHRGSYNQVACGLEALGKNWDFRVNGYLPIGKKMSPLYGLDFGFISDNSIYLKEKFQFTLGGFNAEISAHLNPGSRIPLCISGGGYYLNGKGRSTWGGEARAELAIYDYVKLEGNVSYDHFFKWIGQGQFSFVIPLGNQTRKKQANFSYCDQRAVQRVERHEIIPISRKQKTSLAINSANGLPYHIIYVNNTSHSNGTIESPYPTLLEGENASAPHDIIAVFSGDGTTTGYDAGITLKPYQQFWGLGIPHTLNTSSGPITFPPLSQTPNISNASGNVVTLANGNTVSDFNILNTNGDGLTGSPITGLMADHLAITGGASGNGITLTNVLGTILIHDCQFTQSANAAISISESVNGSQCSISCSSNTYVSSSSAQGISTIVTSGGSLGSLSIAGSNFTGNTGAFGGAIFTGVTPGGALGSLSIAGGSFIDNNAEFGGAIYTIVESGGALGSLTISSGTFTGNSATAGNGGAIVTQIVGALGSLSMTNGTYSDNSSTDLGGAVFTYLVGTANTATMSGGSYSNNSATDNGGAVYSEIAGTVSLLSITGGTYSNNSVGMTGGALYTMVDDTSTLGTLSITSGTFSGNSASMGGGACSMDIGGTPSTGTGLGTSVLTNPLIFSNNSISATGTGSGTGLLLTASATGGVVGIIESNTFTATGGSWSQGAAIDVVQTTGDVCFVIESNTASPATNSPYYLDKMGVSGSFTYQASNNTPAVTAAGGATPGSCP